jgi:hypothetical protein
MTRATGRGVFEGVTDEEILCLWRSIKGRSISENEAWIAVVTGLTLDIAFANGETEYADRTLGSSLLDPTSH